MALIGFPDRIRVRLGSSFVGGGYGLDEGDVLILTRSGDTYTEDPNGSTSPDTSTNRITFRQVSVGIADFNSVRLIRNPTTGIFLSAVQCFVTLSQSTDYRFKDILNIAAPQSILPNYATRYSLGVFVTLSPPSWSPSTGITGGRYGNLPNTQAPAFFAALWGSVFSEIEEYVRAPDKTTYRYG